MKKYKLLNAFTLAELLITIAVIGIVATLTIPTLVQKYKERETVLRVKEFYSVISQAYQMAIIEHGTFDQWELGDSASVTEDDGSVHFSDATLKNIDTFFKYLMPYLNYSSYIPLSISNIGTDAEGNPKEIDKRGLMLNNGILITNVWLHSSSCNDGYDGAPSYCGDFYIVTDGGPAQERRVDGKNYNRKEVFTFVIASDKIIPLGLHTNLAHYQNIFKKQCMGGTDYSRCTGWVIQNGNMDYLHCNDLDVNTKTKCD